MRYINALFVINACKQKIICSSVLNDISQRIPSRSIRYYSTSTVHREFKSVPQEDVFMLPMKYVEKLPTLIRPVFCLLTKVGFLIRKFFLFSFISLFFSVLFCCLSLLVLAHNCLFSCCQAC
jgi:hypothetical protein